MNEEETDSPTIITTDVTLIETDLEVETIGIEIIIIETEAALEIEIIVMTEMTTVLEVETDLLLGDLVTELPHPTTEMLTILMELLLLLPLPTSLLVHKNGKHF
jgi:hypothetical protein